MSYIDEYREQGHEIPEWCDKAPFRHANEHGEEWLAQIVDDGPDVYIEITGVDTRTDGDKWNVHRVQVEGVFPEDFVDEAERVYSSLGLILNAGEQLWLSAVTYTASATARTMLEGTEQVTASPAPPA